MKNFSKLVSAAVAISLACVTGAMAQSKLADKLEARVSAALPKVQAACSAELQKYCSAVTPGEGRQYYCILAHEDKIGKSCDYAMYKAASAIAAVLNQLEKTADACSADMDKYCAKTEPGEGRIVQCLAKNEKTLTKACGSALKNLSALK